MKPKKQLISLAYNPVEAEEVFSDNAKALPDENVP